MWAPIMNITFRPGKEIRTPESAKCFLLESGIREFFWWNLESWVLESIIQLKETGMVLTIEIRNPSSIDKEAEIQKSRLSWIPLHRANKYRLFLKSYSDAEKRSNLEKEWDKENV